MNVNNKIKKIYKMPNLEKLTKLCNIVNSRYEKQLNDDDQVARMFEFEKSVKDVRVVIGWDTYKAMSVTELKEKFKTATRKTKFEFYIGEYKCILPIEKY